MQIQMPPIIFRPMLPPLPEPNHWVQPDAFVVYATLALAIVTFLLVLETRRMRLGSDHAIGELTRQAAHAATAAQESAAAAGRSAAHSEVMLQSRRAWVGVEKCESSRASQTVEPTYAYIYFVNSGDSPALDVQIGHAYKYWRKFDEDRVDYDDYFEPTHSVLGPNLPIDKFIEFKYPDEPTRQEILAGSITIYWYGIVRYRDIFDQNRETKFCYQYNLRNQRFELCILHNSAT